MYWYIILISMFTSFFSNKTKYKYAPLLCILLILTVPPLFPPSPLGLLAITDVQINDLIALRKFIIQGIKAVNNMMQLAEIFLPIGIGSLLLLLYGCKIGFIIYSLASTLFALIYILKPVRIPYGFEENSNATIIKVVKYLSLIILSVSANGFPYLQIEGHNRFDRLALALLAAVLINTIVSLVKIGLPLLQINLLALIVGGSIIGRYISSKIIKKEKVLTQLLPIHFYITFILGFISIILEIKLKII
ncbi:hypothetical protein [Saccharolobus shibatae]|nr:hypothetical protein [Saccharolobus shibatae]